MKKAFDSTARRVSEIIGSAWAFVIAVAIIAVWGVTGPLFGFSDTWQLIINTGTTIVTFLVVFLIQNTQNRGAKAMQLKLDELVEAVHGAKRKFEGIEDLTEEELDALKKQFEKQEKKGKR